MRNMTLKLVLVAALLSVVATASGDLNGDYATLIQLQAVNFLPSSLHAGDQVSMAVGIYNRANYINIVDLNGSLDTGSQFTPVLSNSFIGQVRPGETKTMVLKFNVNKSTLPGYYPVTLTLGYLREGTPVIEKETIQVPVSASVKNLVVNIEPKSINPGNQTAVTFTVTNISAAPVSNLALSWVDKSSLILPLGSDNKKYIDVLDPGESHDFEYTVAADPNISPGIYPLTVDITSTDYNGSRTQESSVGLIVGGGTNFDVSADVTNGTQLSVSVVNIGSNNASAVVVKIPKQQGISVSGSDTGIIGNLNKGDYALANFTLGFGGRQGTQYTGGQQAFDLGAGSQQGQGLGTAQDNNGGQGRRFGSGQANGIQLEIDYTDTTGERRAVTKAASLSFASTGAANGTANGFNGRRGQQGPPLTEIALAVIFVAGIAGYNHFRARKSWKKTAVLAAGSVVLFGVSVYVFSSNIITTIVAVVISLATAAWFFLKHGAGKK